MFSATKIATIFAALAANTLAFDVYSQFWADQSTKITATSFDTKNGGCFTVNGASYLSFTQHDEAGDASGPYCLTSYTEGGCGTVKGRQQFGPVSPNSSPSYLLSGEVANSSSYTWSPTSCP